MKSGTTFIQDTLKRNREGLAEQGFLFPGSRWREQVLGVLDVLDQQRHGAVVDGAPGSWDRLLEEMAAFEGTAIISMEFLAASPREKIEKVVHSLAPARVQVVVTLRDLGRNLPAMWQEGLKNGATLDWTDYLDQVRSGDTAEPGFARQFWRRMAYPSICRRWSEVVGPEHMALITVPHPGAPWTVLWQRFCSVTGLDARRLPPSPPGNASISAPSALVLRRLNERLRDDGVPLPYPDVVKHSLAKRGMAERKEVEAPIGFQVPDWLSRRAAKQIAQFRELDLPVVGDLEELRPVTTRGVDLTEVTVEEQLDAAVAALNYLVQAWPTPAS